MASDAAGVAEEVLDEADQLSERDQSRPREDRTAQDVMIHAGAE